ncbi:hypothetical protein FOPG_16191 [Fusarium oxysporum f. sp. conglutinans race 2 54008]|uniref:Uncharacterized protein n=1 Tax=Fusarium oxysporum f. sp. conglutinans race 2 54008 TaxID=1089457 RepID=X0GVM1_FUSOX|nr:hypothetical protein FOPG_16191 [Fusarium oxysporum f. sp. conglutinans race 2 54008]KAG6989115.1 hypothetical protein FocnCong_v020963 [Fusarium oxysporum f. sp. conglutinans]
MSGSSIHRGCGNPSVGSFSKFDPKLAPGHDRARQRTHEATWVKLAEAVPKDEEDWRLARHKHAFSTPADMVKTLEDLLDGEKKSQLYKTVYLASRYVILRGGSSHREAVYTELRKCLGNEELKEEMLDIYMKAVVMFVKVLDDLFLKGLLHRAFELVLYIPIQISHLRLYGPNQERFVTYLSIQKPPVEIQGSLLLSIPFLVHRLFPELSLTSIQNAFGTTIHSPAEYRIFERALQGLNMLPRIPSRPIEVLNIPQSLLSDIPELATKLRGYNPMLPLYVPPSTQMHCCQWPDDKDRLTGVLWEILTSQNLLNKGDHRLSKRYAVHHDEGRLPTPDNHVQVLIPVIDSTVAESQVSLDPAVHDRKWRHRWEAGQWILMQPGTSLLPEQPVEYLALLFLISSTDPVRRTVVGP